MNINDLVKKFTIKPSEDIEPNFKLKKEIKINAGNHKSCYNCNDVGNQINLKSEAWTGVQHCLKCNHLNVIYYQDRMGGSYSDIVKCYTNK